MLVSKELTAASTTPLILAILTEGDSYGYAIIKRVMELSSGKISWTEGMLYPVLHRLEEAGCLEAYWSSESGNRKRKYYRITESGRSELDVIKSQWNTVHAALERGWGGKIHD